MATLAITFTAGSETGAQIRELARQLTIIGTSMPDRLPTGASTVLTFDNAPGGGAVVSAQVTAGPYTTGLYYA